MKRDPACDELADILGLSRPTGSTLARPSEDHPLFFKLETLTLVSFALTASAHDHSYADGSLPTRTTPSRDWAKTLASVSVSVLSMASNSSCVSVVSDDLARRVAVWSLTRSRRQSSPLDTFCPWHDVCHHNLWT